MFKSCINLWVRALRISFAYEVGRWPKKFESLCFMLLQIFRFFCAADSMEKKTAYYKIIYHERIPYCSRTIQDQRKYLTKFVNISIIQQRIYSNFLSINDIDRNKINGRKLFCIIILRLNLSLIVIAFSWI